MIFDALIITLLGMGTVFLFLFVMTAAIDLLGSFLPYLSKFMPEAASGQAAAAPVAGGDSSAIAIAIAAACKHSGRTI